LAKATLDHVHTVCRVTDPLKACLTSLETAVPLPAADLQILGRCTAGASDCNNYLGGASQGSMPYASQTQCAVPYASQTHFGGWSGNAYGAGNYRASMCCSSNDSTYLWLAPGSDCTVKGRSRWQARACCIFVVLAHPTADHATASAPGAACVMASRAAHCRLQCKCI
jgi:hypothetical protein